MSGLAKAIATLGGLGFLRPAPGTWGSAVAVPLAWGLHGIGGLPLFLAALVGVFAVGWWATAQYTATAGDHDPSEVIIDEVVGQWIALLPLSAGLWAAGAPQWLFPYPGWVGGFLLFRLFDIWKPGPVGWADRRGDALGVMLDDVIAGLLAACGVALAAAIAHIGLAL